MQGTATEILLLFSRYYFVLLIVVITGTLASTSLRELMQKDRREGPAYGELTVLSPGEGRTSLKAGQSFVLEMDNTLGRSRRCDIRLTDDSVKRLHVQLYMNDDRMMLVDLGGAFGTFVNGIRVEKSEYLFSGDVLQLGRVLLRLKLDDPMARSEYFDEYGDEYDEEDVEENAFAEDDHEEYDDVEDEEEYDGEYDDEEEYDGDYDDEEEYDEDDENGR